MNDARSHRACSWCHRSAITGLLVVAVWGVAACGERSASGGPTTASDAPVGTSELTTSTSTTSTTAFVPPTAAQLAEVAQACRVLEAQLVDEVALVQEIKAKGGATPDQLDLLVDGYASAARAAMEGMTVSRGPTFDAIATLQVVAERYRGTDWVSSGKASELLEQLRGKGYTVEAMCSSADADVEVYPGVDGSSAVRLPAS